MACACVCSLLSLHYSHVHTNDFLRRKSISWGEFLNYAFCVGEIMDSLKRLSIAHLQHLLDAPLLFKIQANNGRASVTWPGSSELFSSPSILKYKWRVKKTSTFVELAGYTLMFNCARPQMGAGKDESRREDLGLPSLISCRNCGGKRIWEGRTWKREDRRPTCWHGSRISLWFWLCGFVVLDKHKQEEISSQVNNPICRKQPSVSPWQRVTDAEESPHIPWWSASKIPRSRALVSAKGRTWHSVCGERSDLHVSPSHLLQPWYEDPITTCKWPPAERAIAVIHCISALAHGGDLVVPVCVWAGYIWGMFEHLCLYSLYICGIQSCQSWRYKEQRNVPSK